MPGKLRKRFLDAIKFVIIANRFKLREEETLKQIDCKIERDMRKIFLKNPWDRTEEEIDKCLELATNLRDMHKFKGINLRELARETYYINARSGRVFLRTLARPERVYFVIAGNVLLIVNYSVEYTTEMERMATQLTPGDCFGEYSMLLDQPRTESAKALTNCEALYITRETFDRVMRFQMQRHYDHLNLEMRHVHLLGGMNQRNLHEFAYFGNIMHFKAGDILMTQTNNSTKAFFLLNGECQLIEILDLVRNAANELVPLSSLPKNYRVEDVKELITPPKQSSFQTSQDSEEPKLARRDSLNDSAHNDGNPTRAILKGYYGDITTSKSSTLLDFYVRTSQYADIFIEPHFMKICNYRKNEFFNIGESIDNRCVVAKKNMKVLAVPKQVLLNKRLLSHSKALRSLRAILPTSAQVYQTFRNNRKEREWRKSLIERLDWPKCCSNTISNIPYCIRLARDFDFTEEQARKAYKIWSRK